ncbi:MAG: type II toxin-antitoxin system RelE/ParE family toxin [candidate division NC10 bacterium]|nr:type II toxin-antitoxin system RelE/ParE family toxin [candidate division NC10 bacterium]
MASARVEKQLAAVSEADRAHVVTRLLALADQPRPKGGKALARNVYRLRVGRYRVIYKIFDREQIVLIGKVAPRAARTYQDLEDLF